jgi:hypothetical protein
LHLDEGIKKLVERRVIVSEKCDVDLGLPEEVVKDRKHLILGVVVAFKPWHFKNQLQCVQVAVAEVMQQVVVVVTQHWRQEPKDLVVSDLNSALQHRVTDQGFPDVVLK